MPYLVDGHNLIPKIRGLSLTDLEDEMQLLEMLQEYCRMQQKNAEVFFDNAPPGGVRVRKFGRVIARFIRQGTSADAAIYQRLQQLGRSARNWTVVSSDHAVQGAGRQAGAHVISSEKFALLLRQALQTFPQDKGKTADASLDETEVEEWLQLFGSDGDNSD